MKLVILSLVLVAGLYAMPLESKNGIFTVEMVNSGSLRAKLIKAGIWSKVYESMQQVKATGSQPFIDYYDDFYLANVSTGTPAQHFTIVPDTGSSNYWLIDALKCTKPACKGYPQSGYKKHLFDHSKSSTFKNDGHTFSIQYGSGSCSGTLGIDVLTMAGLTYNTQTFGLASTIADVFGYQPVDGILGLGWPALAVDHITPPMQNLLNKLDKPLFTVWMDRKTKPSEGGNGGLITYGALDTKNCDPNFAYVPLSSKTYWQFPIDGFSIGTYSSTKKEQVISDTGTSWLGGPKAEIEAIVKNAKATYDSTQGIYTVPCTDKNLPNIIFTIGGHKYNIPHTEYVLDLGLGGGKCGLTIFDMGGGGFGPAWILGDTFIRTYCNVYDIGGGRIGFSKAHHQSA